MPGAKGRAWTDAEGRFRIEGVETGSRWLLRARGNGVEGAGPLPVEAPAAGIRVAVRACGAVTGRLVPRGAIEPGTNRAFRYRRGEERRGMPDRPSGTLHRVDAFGDGSFRVEGLPPGPGTLLVSADGREFEPVRIEVPEGGVFEAGDVVESAAAPRGPR